MGSVRRIYVEKKEPFAVKAKELHEELKGYLGINVEGVRVFIRYDVENISDQVFERACRTVFSEPPVDDLYRETIEIPAGAKLFSVEYLPGQFDQRADSAVQCVQFLDENEEPVIRTAVTYMILGDVSQEEFQRIKSYCINPVDSRETGNSKPETLIVQYEEPADIAVFQGFIGMETRGGAVEFGHPDHTVVNDPVAVVVDLIIAVIVDLIAVIRQIIDLRAGF